MKKAFLLIIFFHCLFFIYYFYSFETRSSLNQHSMISLSINGNLSPTFPTKESGYQLDAITCNEGVQGLWDYESWSLKLSKLMNNKIKCHLSFISIYKDPILNGTDPVLKDRLVPIIIQNDGKVVKAAPYDRWYDYEHQIWANAVILEDESINYQ